MVRFSHIYRLECGLGIELYESVPATVVLACCHSFENILVTRSFDNPASLIAPVWLMAS